jgi:hypothetical protein
LEVDLTVDRPVEGMGCVLILRRATDGMVMYDGFFPFEDMGRPDASGALTVAFDHHLHATRGQYAYELAVFDAREQRHRLRIPLAAGVRVDEYRSFSGAVDLEVDASVRDRAPERLESVVAQSTT